MGYIKLVQAGLHYKEYRYSKDYVRPRKRNSRRKKRLSTTDYQRNFAQTFRSSRSIQRAKTSFFDLVSSNLQGIEKPIFLTLTIAEIVDDVIGWHYLKGFFARFTKIYGKETKYIAVPEWQERGAIHFHVLLWCTDNGIIEREGSTRNIQRLWARGFIDLRPVEYNGLGIAGYMAKYLVKGLEDSRLSNKRAYSCSRNILRPTAYGSNTTFYETAYEYIPDDYLLIKQRVYNTLYLGECTLIIHEQA